MRKVIFGLIAVGLLLALVVALFGLLPTLTPDVVPATPTLEEACTVVGPGESLSLQQMEASEKVETQFELAPGFSLATVTPEKALPGARCGVNVP
jgi:hypothetical protein